MANGGGGGGGGSVWIVKELYDSESAFEKFGDELELALRKGTSTIVIEPPTLAEQTGRWISVGNFLHKGAVLFGISSIVVTYLWPKQTSLIVGFTGCSLLCTVIYTNSWQSDPCCKYQVERNRRRLQRLRLPSTNTAVVLRRRDDKYRKFLHTSISCLSLGACIYGIYRYRT